MQLEVNIPRCGDASATLTFCIILSAEKDKSIMIDPTRNCIGIIQDFRRPSLGVYTASTIGDQNSFKE